MKLSELEDPDYTRVSVIEKWLSTLDDADAAWFKDAVRPGSPWSDRKLADAVRLHANATFGESAIGKYRRKHFG